MAENQVEEVKRKTDIVAVISERVKLAKAGRNFKGLCPFHSEKTPSFMVSPELGIYKCFGCNAGGDVISFLEQYEGMDFPEALEYLADRVGVRLVRRGGEDRSRGEKDRLIEINHLAGEFYHYLLTSHRVGERARQYLKNRGVSNEAVRVFKLGYAAEDWEGLQQFLVKKKGYKAEELEKAGLVIKSEKGSYYDRFRGRLMFPLTDGRGKILGFAGRVLDPKVKEAKYVNTPETLVYHKGELLYGLAVSKGEIKQEDMAVVVEGELDAIASWQAGVKNVVAIKGSAFTEEQIRLLARYTKNLRLALDADTAGQAATRRSIAIADSLGMNVRVVELVSGKDPDELVRTKPNQWREAIKRAVNVYDFYLRNALARVDAQSGEGKRAVSGELAPILAGIDNQVEQAHYVKLLAEELGVTEEAVRLEMKKAGVERRIEAEPSSAEATEGTGKSRSERLEEYWLGLVLQGQPEVERLESMEGWLDKGAVKRLVEELKLWLAKKREWEVKKWVAGLPAELRETAERAWLVNEEEWEEAKLNKEREGAEMQLKKLRLQEQLGQLSRKIKSLEQEGAEKQVAAAQKEFVGVSEQMRALGE